MAEFAGSVALFDFGEVERAEVRGRGFCRQSVLALARDAVRECALARPDRVATVYDASLFLPRIGSEMDDSGDVEELIFGLDEWSWTGNWIPSRRKLKRQRQVRVWRLR